MKNKEIVASLNQIHLAKYVSTLKQCNDTHTITIQANSDETEGDFGDRVNNVAKRLRMNFIVISIESNYQLSPASAEIEFTYGIR